MYKFEALFIKYLQCRLGLDYRDISAKWEERYGFKIPFSNKQITSGSSSHGEYLCDEAKKEINSWQLT